MTDSSEERGSQATKKGPSWVGMLLLILLAMLVALGIAWAFISPLLHRR